MKLGETSKFIFSELNLYTKCYRCLWDAAVLWLQLVGRMWMSPLNKAVSLSQAFTILTLHVGHLPLCAESNKNGV